MDAETKSKIVATLSHVAARFKEPSSWAGLAPLLVLLGLHLDPGVIQDVVYIGTGAAGLLAFFLKEAK